MLYVFQMDTGQMLTFDMTLLMDTVSRLQVEISKTTGIGVDYQILLLSGGQSLRADQKVITYGAGADTNPVFLFSKLAIESQDAPVIRSYIGTKDAMGSLKERVSEVIKLRPSIETVNLNVKLAVQMRDNAASIYDYCKNEFQEQHLQHQGWAAVIANMEEIADALNRTKNMFNKVFTTFFSLKEGHAQILDGFSDVMRLLNQIPLLYSLKDADTDVLGSRYKWSERSISISSNSLHSTPSTLLDWVGLQSQGRSIECVHQKCEEDLKMFTESMFESYDKQVHDLLISVRTDHSQMKELVGIERRLSELEKRLNEAKRITTSQNEMAQGFIKHQSKLSTLLDVTGILPELCESHKQQLIQMLESQQRIVALQNNFKNSKQEMSRNIHQRLGWVMHIETKISKLDNELICHIRALKIFECNMELLGQIKKSPQMYADLVVETVRRRFFSHKFAEWADVFVDDANRLYEMEVKRRKEFSSSHGEHFLIYSLFQGISEKMPNETTKVPRMQDSKLPEITSEEIMLLKSAVPEWEDSLSTEIMDPFTNEVHNFSKDRSDRQTSPPFKPKMSFSHSPSIITATEGPATPFTIPESTISNNVESGRKGSVVEKGVKKTVDKSCQQEAITSNSKESQTSVNSESKCVGTIEDDSETDSSKGANVSGKKTADSSSPVSSSEFATADFYFEDSMPSPMVEASSEGKSESQSQTKRDVSKENLLNQVKEKNATIDDLNQMLVNKEEEIAALKRDMLSLKGENSEQMEFFSLIGPLEEESLEKKEIEVDANVGTACQTDNSVDDRVKDLEQKLEKLTNDLNQSQLSLTKAEENLQSVQEQEQTVNEEKQSLICDLQEKIKQKHLSLENATLENNILEEKISNFDDLVCNLTNEKEKLSLDLESSYKTHKTFKCNMTEKLNTLMQMVPLLRKDTHSLRESMKDNLLELNEFQSSTSKSIEKEIGSFSSIISNIDREKQKLLTEIISLNEELKKNSEENANEVNMLTAQIESLNKSLDEKETLFTSKFSEQQNDFNCALRDIETKHALVTELEVDKCRAEMECSIQELQIKFTEEMAAKNNLVKEVESLRMDHESERSELMNIHKNIVQDLEKKVELKTQECIDLKEKLEESQRLVLNLENEATVTAATTNKEQEDSLELLKAQLESIHCDVITQLKQDHEEQTENYAKTIEELQLNHAYKLTDLKKSFDVERDLLQTQINKLKDIERNTIDTQTDEYMNGSDGSDELRQVCSGSSLEEKGNKSSKKTGLQSTDLKALSETLETANETIQTMDDAMKAVLSENVDLKEKLKLQEAAGGSETVPGLETDQQQNIMQNSAITKSFMIMEKSTEQPVLETDERKLKDQKIANLEKRIMEISVTSESKTPNHDKIAFRGCDVGDLVLLCLDEKHDQYVVFTVGTNLHFLHSDSLEGCGLKADDELKGRKPWILAEVLDKEYCLAKKANNRFRVPQGTCFYRVKCQIWKCEIDLTRHKESKHKASKNEQANAVAAKPKKTEKK